MRWIESDVPDPSHRRVWLCKAMHSQRAGKRLHGDAQRCPVLRDATADAPGRAWLSYIAQGRLVA